jgi:hypothetical protein
MKVMRSDSTAVPVSGVAALEQPMPGFLATEGKPSARDEVLRILREVHASICTLIDLVEEKH